MRPRKQTTGEMSRTAIKPRKQTAIDNTKPGKQTDGYETEAEREFWTEGAWIQELREVLMTVYDPPPKDESEPPSPKVRPKLRA